MTKTWQKHAVTHKLPSNCVRTAERNAIDTVMYPKLIKFTVSGVPYPTIAPVTLKCSVACLLFCTKFQLDLYNVLAMPGSNCKLNFWKNHNWQRCTQLLWKKQKKSKWRISATTESTAHLTVGSKMLELTEFSCVWLHSTKRSDANAIYN